MGSVTLDELRRAGSVYPTRHLKRAETALVLFSSAFLGRQDAIFMLDAGISATCVDSDAQKLEEMRKLYPWEWNFVHDDVYRFAAVTEQEWDVVSLDPPTNQSSLCAEMMHLWCALARQTVVLGGVSETHAQIKPPKGWRKLPKPLLRSTFMGGIFWTVLRKKTT